MFPSETTGKETGQWNKWTGTGKVQTKAVNKNSICSKISIKVKIDVNKRHAQNRKDWEKLLLEIPT